MTGDPRQQLSDHELLATYHADPNSGDGRRAASDLLSRYQQRVYQWSLGYAHDPDQALDLAQEILIKAYRGLDGFDQRAKFSTWLYSIARHCCLDAVRRPTQHHVELSEVPEIVSPRNLPDAEVETEQEQQALRLLLRARLDAQEEEALWLRCIERMSVDQISRILGLTNASGARAMLQTARRKLRKHSQGRDLGLLGME